MGESQKWGQTRYAVLFAVSGLHVALVIALISVAKVRFRLTSAPHPIELLVLPPNASPTMSKPPPLLDRAKKENVSSTDKIEHEWEPSARIGQIGVSKEFTNEAKQKHGLDFLLPISSYLDPRNHWLKNFFHFQIFWIWKQKHSVGIKFNFLELFLPKYKNLAFLSSF